MEVPLHALGQTRSHVQRDHILHTPDAFVWAAWPGFANARCATHASPAHGARFTLYTAELGAGGRFAPPAAGASRFVYVRSGALTLEGGAARTLGPDGYACLPPNAPHLLESATGATALVIEKPYVGDPGGAPGEPLVGDAGAVDPTPLLGDPDVLVRALLPNAASFDFAVNVMTFVPGARLAQVEVHVMEHGLAMLAGEGIYRLGERWHAVQAGDVIYMAPYCPQWFGALGRAPGRYLIYKDWNRHPLAE